MSNLVARSTVLSPPSNGIVGGYTGDNLHVQRVMIAFSAIAWYNCAELIFLICLRFKRWRGLYFTSLMVTSWSIVIYQIGSFGKMNNICRNPVVMTVFTNVGWLFMILGNSLVLYSRLHLLTQNRTLLRCVLWGIIINTFCMYIPTTALDVGTNIADIGNPAYVQGYSIMERIQMSLFTLQEFLISGVYLVEAWRFLKLVYHGDKSIRNIMYELVAVNVILIVLDIALLTVAQKNLFAVEVTFKGFVYSVKLKLELGVLSRLVKIVTSTSSGVRSATIEKDLATLSANSQAFTGLDFCTSPFQEKGKVSYESTNTTSPNTSRERPTSASGRKPKHSIPWLSSNPATLDEKRPPERLHTRLHRAMSAQAVGPLHTRFNRRNARQESVAISPTDKAHPVNPASQQPRTPQSQQHVLQRGELYANSEFLTSAAVTEGANDENIRQFNREIELELGGGSQEQLERAIARQHSHVRPDAASFLASPSLSDESTKTETAERYERAEEARRSGALSAQQTGSTVSRVRTGTADSEEGEQEWQRKLGVLGGQLQSFGIVESSPVSPTTSIQPKRPAHLDRERERSLEDLYPGKITGGKV